MTALPLNGTGVPTDNMTHMTKKLSYLLERLEHTGRISDPDREITAVCYDTRAEIVPGCIFICIRGAVHDSHDYASTAVERGAAAIVADHEIELAGNAGLIVVPDTRKALSVISAAWFGYPAESLRTIGITGTKGKSTTSYMLRNILECAGHRTGVIGTIGIAIGDRLLPTSNTTPESYIIQQSFRQMVDEGCDTVVMEVSSQGLKQSRVYGVVFDYAIFTNLEPDHIGDNEHSSFEEYMYCKSLLFKQCRTAIVNGDSEHATDMLSDTVCAVEAFSCADSEGRDSEYMSKLKREHAELPYTTAVDTRLIADPGHCGIGYHVTGSIDCEIELEIPGRFNVSNSLAAVAAAVHFTGDAGAIREGLRKTRVRGRLEPVRISDRFSLMIDYAHNAMALESLLTTLREYSPRRLVCLFGCGGNRSKDRRFEMGEVSSRLADLSIVTSDNPRYEKPEDIIADIMVGIGRANGSYVMIPDRREAIRYAIEHAETGDLIVLAGKGNEDYQEIEGVKYPMDERDIIADIVRDGRF